jgi:hypothetical protein
MSKDKLFALYSPNEIYCKFLGLSEFPLKNISSPFSKDTNPSFKLYQNGTFKCFSSGKQGDVFCFVAELNGLDCKREFPQILQIIYAELGINFNQNQKTLPLKKEIHSNLETLDKKKNTLENKEIHFKKEEKTSSFQTHFSYTTKEFNFLHFSFWMQGNWQVTPDILEKYKVKALDQFEFYSEEKKDIQKFKVFDGVIGFACELGNAAELYIPKQGKNKKFFFK